MYTLRHLLLYVISAVLNSLFNPHPLHIWWKHNFGTETECFRQHVVMSHKGWRWFHTACSPSVQHGRCTYYKMSMICILHYGDMLAIMRRLYLFKHKMHQDKQHIATGIYNVTARSELLALLPECFQRSCVRKPVAVSENYKSAVRKLRLFIAELAGFEGVLSTLLELLPETAERLFGSWTLKICDTLQTWSPCSSSRRCV